MDDSNKKALKQAGMMLMTVNGVGVVSFLLNAFGLKVGKYISCYTLSVFMVLAGLAHFDKSKMDFYLTIMPPMLPYKEELIYLSGVFEVACGALSLIPVKSVRNIGGYLTILTLVGVFPANIYMAMDDGVLKKFGVTKQQAYARLVLQFIMIGMAYIYIDHSNESRTKKD